MLGLQPRHQKLAVELFLCFLVHMPSFFQHSQQASQNERLSLKGSRYKSTQVPKGVTQPDGSSFPQNQGTVPASLRLLVWL